MADEFNLLWSQRLQNFIAEADADLIPVPGQLELHLVAPYCAIPRDYLSDTPLLRAMGFFGVSTWPIGCDTPAPFSEHFPLGEHAKWRCDTPPPPSKGVSQRYLCDSL